MWSAGVAALGALWSLPALGQLLLLAVILFITWYQVAMARQKNVLRSVHKDIVIITQPLICYSPLMFILPRYWLRWLFPYRALDMHEALHEVFTRTGARAVGFASPLHTEVYFNDEDIIREFTVKQHEKFPKAYKDYEVLRFWGENIVTAPSEGYEWKKHRALLTPAFSSSNLRLVAKVTVDNTNTLFAKWDQQRKTTQLGEVLDVHVDEDTMRLMLYVIAGAGFGQELGFDKSDEDYDKSKFSISFTEAMSVVSKYLLLWIAFRPVFKLPFPALRKIQQGFVDFEAHVKDMIANRSAELTAASAAEKEEEKEVEKESEADAEIDPASQRSDLLSLLLKSRAEDARHNLTDEEIFSDSFIFLLAGHETTAHSTAWAFALLATNPSEQERLHEEVVAVLGEDGDPTYDDFDRLIYAQCVFKETLRLMPPVWALGKYCTEHTRLVDHHVAPNIRTTMAIYSLHRNPKYWAEPDKFVPSRFDARVSPPVSAYSYVPFSLGRRSCLGNRFALVEATMFLAKVMQKYTIHLPPGTDLKKLFDAENVITLTPRNGMHLWLKKRNPAHAS